MKSFCLGNFMRSDLSYREKRSDVSPNKDNPTLPGYLFLWQTMEGQLPVDVKSAIAQTKRYTAMFIVFRSRGCLGCHCKQMGSGMSSATHASFSFSKWPRVIRVYWRDVECTMSPLISSNNNKVINMNLLSKTLFSLVIVTSLMAPTIAAIYQNGCLRLQT